MRALYTVHLQLSNICARAIDSSSSASIQYPTHAAAGVCPLYVYTRYIYTRGSPRLSPSRGKDSTAVYGYLRFSRYTPINHSRFTPTFTPNYQNIITDFRPLLPMKHEDFSFIYVVAYIYIYRLNDNNLAIK